MTHDLVLYYKQKQCKNQVIIVKRKLQFIIPEHCWLLFKIAARVNTKTQCQWSKRLKNTSCSVRNRTVDVASARVFRMSKARSDTNYKQTHTHFNITISIIFRNAYFFHTFHSYLMVSRIL